MAPTPGFQVNRSSKMSMGSKLTCDLLVQHTLSIDMSKSWNNQTVKIYAISKGDTPVLNRPVLWSSSDNQSFYSFGGDVTIYDLSLPIPEIAAYQFLAAGNGDGTWTTNKSSDDQIFNSLTRPTGMLSAFFDNTIFMFGGFEIPRSSSRAKNSQPVPGLLSYNGTSMSWRNETSPIQWSTDNKAWGVSVAVPSMGPRGLLIMTGMEYDPRNGAKAMNNVTIYEPTNKKWTYQLATGAVPEGRWEACAVGVQGDNGTFEMYATSSFSSLPPDTFILHPPSSFAYPILFQRAK